MKDILYILKYNQIDHRFTYGANYVEYNYRVLLWSEFWCIGYPVPTDIFLDKLISTILMFR